MALIPCPDCRREVSSAASVCIHCGRPLAAAALESAAPTPPPPLPAAPARTEVDRRVAGAKRNATIAYALYALSFVYGVTGVVGLVLSYVFRSDARGTWVESHFDWQIRTFWWSLVAMIGLAVVGIVLSLSVAGGGGGEEGLFAGVGLATVGIFAVVVWVIYRVARGWVRLADDREV